MVIMGVQYVKFLIICNECLLQILVEYHTAFRKSNTIRHNFVSILRGYMCIHTYIHIYTITNHMVVKKSDPFNVIIAPERV